MFVELKKRRKSDRGECSCEETEVGAKKFEVLLLFLIAFFVSRGGVVEGSGRRRRRREEYHCSNSG